MVELGNGEQLMSDAIPNVMYPPDSGEYSGHLNLPKMQSDQRVGR